MGDFILPPHPSNRFSFPPLKMSVADENTPTASQTQTQGEVSEKQQELNSRRVYVGNLSFKTNSTGLKEAFAQYGDIENAHVVTIGKKRRGFGFVTFASPDDASKAVQGANGTELDGRSVRTEISTSTTTPQKKKKPAKKAPAAAESESKPADVCVLPYGGGTSVSEALLCPEEEERMIVSLDMKMMNRLLWVDRESLMACVEGGIVGAELDSRLDSMGLCMGHEPDSREFSTLGGWVATRASGMKKNIYGNIEDIVVHIKMATPTGTIEKNCRVPRMSAGPDIHQIMLGSEGILGVITEVTVKLQPLPDTRAYGSIVFPDFEHGVAFMREVAYKRAQPASIRLMDNTQFQMGQCLTPGNPSKFGWLTDGLKHAYLTKWAKFDLEQMVACTVLFEGDKEKVTREQKLIYALADKHGGINAGQTNGRKGYFLTYMIAYLRDYSFAYYLIGESFETSIPWANVRDVCYRVQERIEQSADEFDLPYAPMCSYRITQLYDTGACVYFYFGFIFRGLEDPVRKFGEIEALARDVVVECGGSISHHHGVGKLRKNWLAQTNSPLGNSLVANVKRTVDPTNVLANGNLLGIVGRQQ